MYNKNVLTEVLDKIENFFSKHLVQFEEKFIELDDVFSESEKMEEIKNILKFYDSTTEIDEGIDFDSLISLWKIDIIKEYDKKKLIYDEFNDKKIGLTNDISTKMIAAEKSFGMSVDIMDDILEYRTNLLKDNLIDSNIITYNNLHLEILNNNLVYGLGEYNNEEKKYFNSDWLLNNDIDDITYWVYIKNKISYIVCLLIEIINENHFKVDENMQKIEFIDASINEIVEIVSTCSIMVAASPKKREILISSYDDASVKKQISEIFIGTHSGVEEKFVGQSMKKSLIKINEKNEYALIFKKILSND